MGENYKKYLKKGSAFLVAPALFGSALPGSNASAVDLSSSLNTIGNFLRVFPEWAYALFLGIIFFGNNKTLKKEIFDCADNGSEIRGHNVFVLGGRSFWYEICKTDNPYANFFYISIHDENSNDRYLVLPGYEGNLVFKYEGTEGGFCKNLEVFDLENEKIYEVPGDFYKPEYIHSGGMGLGFGKDRIEKCRLVSLGKYSSRRAELKDIGVCLHLIRLHDSNSDDWKRNIFPNDLNISS